MDAKSIKTKLIDNIKLGKVFKVRTEEDLVFITVDALEEKDLPYNISMNGMYLTFMCDRNKLVLVQCGCVWLSNKDKETDEYRNLAMRRITSLVPKKFRKCTVKSEDDMIKRISSYVNEVFESLENYTGGYPYKKGI